MYDCKEFSVIDVVVTFGGGKGFRKVGTGMKVPIGVLLHEYATGSGEGGVGHDKEGFGMVRECEYGLLQESLLYF